MNMFSSAFSNVFNDNASLMMALLVFLAAGTMAFSVMAFARVRGSVKRRPSHILDESERQANPKRSLRYSSLKAVAQLIDYTTKHYSSTNDENMKLLRRRLIPAGVYEPRGVAYFFIARTALAIGLAAAVFLARPIIASHGTTFFWL